MEPPTDSSPSSEFPADYGQQPSAEHIPNNDDVRRQIFYPQMYRIDGYGMVGNSIAAAATFIFSEKARRRESVVWSKYCTADVTHALGKAKAERDQTLHVQGMRNHGSEYRGFIQATVDDVRTVIPKLFD